MLHKEYATKSIQDLFPVKTLKQSTIKQINYLPSVVAINEGEGSFRIEALPFEAQISSVNASQFVDLNNDGAVDLVLGGNNTFLLPQLSELDANKLQVYINDGSGHFKYSGDMGVEGVVRDIVLLENRLLVGINNSPFRTFKMVQ